MKKQKILIDVDLTIIRTDVLWDKWLRSQSEHRPPYGDLDRWYNGLYQEEKVNYNLSSYYPDVEKPFKFWNNLDYRDKEPEFYCKDVIRQLSEKYDIQFVSHVEGYHGESKYMFLKKHFPYNKGVYFTREKSGMNGSDVAFMIDDRYNHLIGFEKEKRILKETVFTQDVPDIETEFSFSEWTWFEKILKEKNVL